MIAALSTGDHARRRPAPVNTSIRRTTRGTGLRSEIDICRAPKPAPRITPQISERKVAARQRLRLGEPFTQTGDSPLERSLRR